MDWTGSPGSSQTRGTSDNKEARHIVRTRSIGLYANSMRTIDGVFVKTLRQTTQEIHIIRV